MTLLVLGLMATAASAAVDGADPAEFLPGGMLGVQPGGAWAQSKRNAALHELLCRATPERGPNFDEVCFFKTARRFGGAAVQDGFIVRKGDRVVLIGLGIPLKNAEDPAADAVVRAFEAQVHAGYRHTGDDVLFANLPQRQLSPAEMDGFARRAPVLLVELGARGNELAVLYGYLAPVNAFSALVAQ